MIRTTSSLALLVVLLSAGEARAGGWKIGEAPSNYAKAEYNWATGEFVVSVNEVMSWALISKGKFDGPDIPAVKELLPLAADWHLSSVNPNTIHEGTFGAAFSYNDVYLGRVVQPGLDVSEFVLESAHQFGSPLRYGDIKVVPEPSSLAALATGAVGLAAFAWKRRRRVVVMRR